jgi:hypothetical protein
VNEIIVKCGVEKEGNQLEYQAQGWELVQEVKE